MGAEHGTSLDSDPRVVKRLARVIGPGLIVAATVLGPGTITVASISGSLMGYSILWAVVIAGIFMTTFTRVSARIGCVQDKSLLEIVSSRYGKPLAVLSGFAVFFITAGFQTGNNIGVGLAMQAMIGGTIPVWAFLFLGIALVIIWTAKDFYHMLELVMKGLVLLMIVAFVLNIFMAGPSVTGIMTGLVPGRPQVWGLVIAISATSFSIAGAAYQSYMVQAKGWKKADYKAASRDSIAGIAVLAGLTALIMITAASVLAPEGIVVQSAIDMAIQLEPLLGPAAKWLFLLGLLSASFSSFIANASLGGMMLSDGLGLGNSINDKSVKVLTTALLVLSTIVAATLRENPIELLVLAQATTILGGPLIAIVLTIIGNDKNVMGEDTNSLPVNVISIMAIGWILYLSFNQLMNFL